MHQKIFFSIHSRKFYLKCIWIKINHVKKENKTKIKTDFHFEFMQKRNISENQIIFLSLSKSMRIVRDGTSKKIVGKIAFWLSLLRLKKNIRWKVSRIPRKVNKIKKFTNFHFHELNRKFFFPNLLLKYWPSTLKSILLLGDRPMYSKTALPSYPNWMNFQYCI